MQGFRSAGAAVIDEKSDDQIEERRRSTDSRERESRGAAWMKMLSF